MDMLSDEKEGCFPVDAELRYKIVSSFQACSAGPRALGLRASARRGAGASDSWTLGFSASPRFLSQADGQPHRQEPILYELLGPPFSAISDCSYVRGPGGALMWQRPLLAPAFRAAGAKPLLGGGKSKEMPAELKRLVQEFTDAEGAAKSSESVSKLRLETAVEGFYELMNSGLEDPDASRNWMCILMCIKDAMIESEKARHPKQAAQPRA